MHKGLAAHGPEPKRGTKKCDRAIESEPESQKPIHTFVMPVLERNSRLAWKRPITCGMCLDQTERNMCKDCTLFLTRVLPVLRVKASRAAKGCVSDYQTTTRPLG